MQVRDGLLTLLPGAGTAKQLSIGHARLGDQTAFFRQLIHSGLSAAHFIDPGAVIFPFYLKADDKGRMQRNSGSALPLQFTVQAGASTMHVFPLFCPDTAIAHFVAVTQTDQIKL